MPLFLAGNGEYSLWKSEGKGQHSTPLHLVNTITTGAILTLLHIVLRKTSFQVSAWYITDEHESWTRRWLEKKNKQTKRKKNVVMSRVKKNKVAD